jgi:hypothetical protein
MQIFGKGIQLSFPENTVARDPFGSLFERFRGEGAAVDPTILLASKESGPLQNLQVFRNRRKGHVKGFRQLSHRRLASGQSCQDRPPCGVGKGRKSGVENAFRIVNHLVNYRSPPQLLSNAFNARRP